MRLALFVATLVAAFAVFFLPNATRASSVTASCPSGVVVPDPPRTTGLDAAIDRQVPVGYRKHVAQGTPGWRNFVVLQVDYLGWGTYAPEDASSVARYRNRVLARCGAHVADATWAVVLDFPACQIPCSRGVAYFARTHAGWRLWWATSVRP